MPHDGLSIFLSTALSFVHTFSSSLSLSPAPWERESDFGRTFCAFHHFSVCVCVIDREYMWFWSDLTKPLRLYHGKAARLISRCQRHIQRKISVPETEVSWIQDSQPSLYWWPALTVAPPSHPRERMKKERRKMCDMFEASVLPSLAAIFVCPPRRRHWVLQRLLDSTLLKTCLLTTSFSASSHVYSFFYCLFTLDVEVKMCAYWGGWEWSYISCSSQHVSTIFWKF